MDVNTIINGDVLGGQPKFVMEHYLIKVLSDNSKQAKQFYSHS